MAERWREGLSAWEDYRAEVEEHRELAGERVLVLLGGGNGRGKASGIDYAHLRSKDVHLLHVSAKAVPSLLERTCVANPPRTPRVSPQLTAGTH
jgi:hypothetical protein